MPNKVIYLDEVWEKRAETIRQKALLGFPWNDLERFYEQVMDPILDYCQSDRRCLIDEAAYRLAYQVFQLGMEASRKLAYEPDPQDYKPCMHAYEGDTEQSVQTWMEQYGLDEADEEEQELDQQSIVYELFTQLATSWFCRGLTYGLRLRKQKLL
ncbi:hypothetical protein NXZ84_13745 [Mechercharimyces sp. CAU 1602]|nr:hypothetical protein [Mechercharimyces sp. CAU 1602]